MAFYKKKGKDTICSESYSAKIKCCTWTCLRTSRCMQTSPCATFNFSRITFCTDCVFTCLLVKAFSQVPHLKRLVCTDFTCCWAPLRPATESAKNALLLHSLHLQWPSCFSKQGFTVPCFLIVGLLEGGRGFRDAIGIGFGYSMLVCLFLSEKKRDLIVVDILPSFLCKPLGRGNGFHFLRSKNQKTTSLISRVKFF